MPSSGLRVIYMCIVWEYIYIHTVKNAAEYVNILHDNNIVLVIIIITNILIISNAVLFQDRIKGQKEESNSLQVQTCLHRG